MQIRQRIILLIWVVALAVSGEAGTIKAPPKAPQEPIDRMLAKIREGDPKGLIVMELRFYETANDLQIIVNNSFHRAHYQKRLQMTQGLAAAWQQISLTTSVKSALGLPPLSV
jgi:hypothetical protein